MKRLVKLYGKAFFRLVSLFILSSLLLLLKVNAEPDNITGYWSKLPTPENMPAEGFWEGRGCPGVDYERGIIFLYRHDDGELWKYSIQDNAFTQIAKFPDTRYDCIYNPSENTIWFTTIGRGETYRLPVTGGELEYIGGSGTYWDNFSAVSYWDSCREKYSLLFGYGFYSVKNWCWQFGVGDTDWNIVQENEAAATVISRQRISERFLRKMWKVKEFLLGWEEEILMESNIILIQVLSQRLILMPVNVLII